MVMESKLDLILQKLDVLDEVKEIVTSLRERHEVTNAKLDALSMSLHEITGEVTSLKQGQERQDKILESLALRSLEQETDLRDLKRIK